MLLASVLILSAACSSDREAPELSDPSEQGSELVNEYFRLVKDGDIEGLKAFISEAFIIQRADGSHFEKAAYLKTLPQIGEYTIGDVTALQAGDSLVVRWVISVNEVIDGRTFSTQPAPRLSTFVYENGKWRLASHANFNAPPSSD